VAAAVEVLSRQALGADNYASAAICFGRPGAQRLGRDPSKRLAYSPAPLRIAASLAPHASPVCPHPIIQSQSGRPGVRMRRSEVMDDSRLLPPCKRRGSSSYSLNWACLLCVRYRYGFNAQISHRLHCGKRMHGDAHISNGSALGPCAHPSPRRLHVQCRHPGRVLKSPSAQFGSTPS
jgi:hypothetical protein